MDIGRLRGLLEGLSSGQVSVDAALTSLSEWPYADLGFARVDHQRALRQGVPEVILAEGKSADQISRIAAELRNQGHGVLITRLPAALAQSVIADTPELVYSALARTARIPGPVPRHRGGARIAVVTAGTSDLPVAEETTETLRACGIEPHRVTDVGVAGLHRLLPDLPRLRELDLVIAIAGMEGALASVLGGLVAVPVVAVPTSVGYGAAFSGLAALLGMLTSCAAGVVVVNIDNGFGAALAAVRYVDAAHVRYGPRFEEQAAGS